MTSLRDTFKTYSAKAAFHLRGREADALRGQPERLHELELVTDSDLLKKYSWRYAIISAGATFFAAPLLASVLGMMLPPILGHFLWFLVKLGMAATCVVIGLAAYYTFGPDADAGGI